ncbi:MAG TPA: hypothetical protein VF212_00265 [Longimicrobiales bacterium]
MRNANVITLVGLAALATAVAPAAALGQVGDTSNVTYPGWIPSDRVAPEITVEVSYDSVAGLWRYDYTVLNGPTAEQPIQSVMLRFNAPTAGVTSPAGWFQMPHFSTAAGAIPGVTFAAEASEELVQTPTGVVPGEPEAAVPPGQSLTGLSIASPYPPGYARSYVQGFAPVPYLPIGFDEPTVVPDDTTNSQRGWTLGPTRYTTIATTGGRRPAVDGFLVFMNVARRGTTLRDPAPIALDLAAGGETVFRETLVVELNGVDVTAAFQPGPADGADLVAVFQLGASPLAVGRNVLTTRIEGIVPGTDRRAADTERLVFTVQP